MQVLGLILVGLIAGFLGGSFGVGGGAIMVPLFVIFFGLSQHQAQGTSLAVMVLPIFIFAVLRYYNAGNVNIKMALIVAAGFMAGAFLGAHFAHGVSDVNLKKAFGVLLMIISLKLMLGK